MQRLSTSTTRWLLLSDIHFKHHDLDRVRQTAQWVVGEAQRHNVGRVVICGDLLTSRTMQPTHVLSACYRFVGMLSEVVPRVHIVLGNHDLAYRRDDETTALDALGINRLSPYVTLHSRVASQRWDGRRVLLLPFREEQGELVKAVAALDRADASETVAFAHLAVNKAITQRYVVGAGADKPRVANSITHRGFTGPEHFASLARTFTGHFHSHQTMLQQRPSGQELTLAGSVTYLGSPLQLSWADLYDEQRGVVLLDPGTLEHELLVNPYAVGYTAVPMQQVLDGQIDEQAVTDKHVMLTGQFNHFKYVLARDKLLSLGVRSVRNWNPTGFALDTARLSFGGFGASVPASDAKMQLSEEDSRIQPASDTAADALPDPEPALGLDAEPRAAKLDLAEEAREYVELVDLDESLLSRRDELIRIGQRVIQVAHELADQDAEGDLSYREFLDSSPQALGVSGTAADPASSSAHIFVAEPRKITITNFLGVQETTTVDFEQDIRRGLTFLVGDNGSGKSTLVEAMVWCQFGRCIRSGLAANDVVNEKMGKNCSVVLEFANGYSIARYRKHKTEGNRVVVSLRGEPQPQLEHPDTRTTQAAINELLGTDYDTYVRTVVLGHESATSFLSLTVAQRRDLIGASLGLSVLDRCGQVSRQLLKDVDKDAEKLENSFESLSRTMEYIEQRIKDLEETQKRFGEEAAPAVEALEAAIQEVAALESQIGDKANSNKEHNRSAHSDTELPEQDASGASGFQSDILTLQDRVYNVQEKLRHLDNLVAQIWEQKLAEPTSWFARLQRQMSRRLDSMAAARPTGLRRPLHSFNMFMLSLRFMAVRGLARILGVPRETSRDTDASVASIQEDMQRYTLQLQTLVGEADRIMVLEQQALDRTVRIKEQLGQLIHAQSAREALQQQVTLKQRDVDTYSRLIETEQASLHSLREERNVLATKQEELATNRELFAFWASSMAKRTRRISSSPSAKATANFHEHILTNSLSELNGLLTEVLTAMYDDTRHSRVLAAGMLRSLFDSDATDTMVKDASSGSVLDGSLAIHPSLAYGKRSGGERKRIDLALFFALLRLSWARSAHRARYLLVDEVFDSLDEAGQAAVVRLCGLLSLTVADWILIITHSRYLAERDPEEQGGMFSVVRAEMKENGVLYKDVKRLKQ